MMKSSLYQRSKQILISLLALLLVLSTAVAQEQEEEIDDLERTFMPTVQMGYVAHGTEELAGGLMVQTSIEYRDISNFIFRLNYDDFQSNINVIYPVNENASFTGRTSFSELIVGVGYRQELKRHNLTAYVQPGFRFYGYPVFGVNNDQVNLDFDSRRIGMNRYSLGYEFMIDPRLFFTIEALAGHVLSSRDFWLENRWSYGLTVGLSAPVL